jgi:hypothetical protein
MSLKVPITNAMRFFPLSLQTREGYDAECAMSEEPDEVANRMAEQCKVQANDTIKSVDAVHMAM